MRWMCSFAVLGMLGSASAVSAQGRVQGALEWLPRADSLPAGMFTLVVLEQDTGLPVAHPLVCVIGTGAWMIGMPDGRVRFNSDTDSLTLAILGPRHETRYVVFAWSQAMGAAARIFLPPRVGPPIEPDCPAADRGA